MIITIALYIVGSNKSKDRTKDCSKSLRKWSINFYYIKKDKNSMNKELKKMKNKSQF